MIGLKKIQGTLQDFTEEDLPKNYKEVFYDCYKVHLSLILRLGLFCVIFLIPFIIAVLLKDGYVLNLYQTLENPTKDQLTALYNTADSIFGIFETVTVSLFFILFAGVIHVLRQLLWGEPVFFGDDYKNGMKQNSGCFFVITLPIAVLSYLLVWLTPSQSTTFLKGIFVAGILPIGIWMMLQLVYYKMGILESMKNALILYIRSVKATVPLLVATVAPFYILLNVVNVPLVKYIGIVVLALLYIIPLTMVWMLYACHIFDRYINKEHYPEIYRKGLRKKEKNAENL